ncbi:MAG: hypothetical protein DRI95_15760 [Bacteroidetes bacterium]|nr:MAG: hypothetical protein DRI95_15760 [Bacteroidota bacterium]
MNKTASIEWLTIAYHDLKSAQILFEANHFTDSIGNDLQQAIEKILKSIFAFKNKKIPKTHNLYELYILTEGLQLQENEINILDTATEYLKEDRYPNPNYILPPKKEIKGVMEFAEELFNIVCNMLGINKKEVIDN